MKEADFENYQYCAAMDRRTCARCGELDGEIFPLSAMNQGENAPPLHPRCRCTIVATFDSPGKRSKTSGERAARDENGRRTRVPADMNYRDWRAIYIDKSKTFDVWQKEMEAQKFSLTNSLLNGKFNAMNSTANENSIVQDNGERNAYTINFKLINSKAYHDKFEMLTKRKAVNEALYKQALRILGHRSGTEYEDLIILDARTGKLLEENMSASGMAIFRCGLTPEQDDKIEKLGVIFEGLHNHPNSSFPSQSDVVMLFTRQLQIASTIVCHNGTVYRMEKLKPVEGIKELVSQVRKEFYQIFSAYREDIIEKRISKEIINQLKKIKALRFKEVPCDEKY